MEWQITDQWAAGFSRKAEVFLRAIEPYCIVKRDEILEALTEREKTRGWNPK
jgi:hypothetical protein